MNTMDLTLSNGQEVKIAEVCDKQFKIVVIADEFHLADSLRDLANLIENVEDPNGIDGFETEAFHYTASVNELN